MDDEFVAFDQAHQKKKKTVVIISAVLIILLAAALLLGQMSPLMGAETPTATQIAFVTTAPPPSATFTPTTAPTGTPTQPTATPTVPTASPTETETEPPPTETPSPPTPTPTSSPTPPPPTPSPTATRPPPTPIAPVIQNPTPGSELPGDALTVFGTAAPEAVIQLYEGDTLLGEATATAGGSWSLIPSQPLDAGEHTIVAIDATTGGASAPVTFTLLGALLPITGREGGAPLDLNPRFP
jgi:outer membrane biosynthesis protein TonB